MKKLKFINLNIAFMLCFLFITRVNGQSLPQTQKNHLVVPANIKIDGRSDEWNKFSAYNNASRVYYSIANDNKNIYVILKMDGLYGNFKALNGGIRFSVLNKASKEIAVSYPAPGNRTDAISDLAFDADYLQKQKKIDAKVKVDSISKVANWRLMSTYKEIEIKHMGGSGEENISLYNTEGIKVAGRFNAAMEYFVEMAIPRAFFNIKPDQKILTYKLSIIGTGERRQKKGRVSVSNPSKLSPDSRYSLFTTFISGEYLL